MQGPDMITIVISGLVKPMMLIIVVMMLYLCMRKRSAALKHFCLLMGMLSLLILPVSAFLIPDMTWEFPFSDFLFQSLPFFWQEYLLKSSYTSIEPLWWQSLLAIYLLGSTSIIFYLLIGFVQLWIIYTKAEVVRDHETLALVDEIRNLFGINRQVTIASSHEFESPCVWGVFSPKILVPQNYNHWTYEQKISVFMHELGHIYRYDTLSLFIVKMTCAVFWFLIPIWWLSRKMARDSEMACDDLIYRLHDKQVQYAEHLLQLARHSKSDSGVVVPMSGRLSDHSEIYHRIMAVLDSKKSRQSIKAESIQYPLLIGILLVMSLAALDNFKLSSAKASIQKSSVFNLSWVTITESASGNINRIETDEMVASVNKFQLQQKPGLITRMTPEREKISDHITQEYKTNLEVDKASLRNIEIDDKQLISAEKSAAYRSLSLINPSYPDSALKKGLTGFVKIGFDLDLNGIPINLRIIDSQPAGVFDQSVINAVSQSRFEWLNKNISHISIQKQFVFQLDTRRKR
jgi:bla regulator protein blaR1